MRTIRSEAAATAPPAIGAAVPVTTPAPASGDARARRILRQAIRAIRQLGESAAVVLGVVTVTFLVTRVLAPDPTNLFLGASSSGFADAQAKAAAMAKVREQLGLNASIPTQYVHFLNQLLHGDLGRSFQTGRTVTSDLWSRFPATAELALYSLTLGVALGVAAGMLAAVRRGRLADGASRLFTIASLAMPQFWVGLMLLWIFSTKLHVAPGPAGRLPIGVAPPPHVTGLYLVDALLAGQWSTAGAALSQLALPVITLAVGLAAPISKVVRTSMIEALASDYVRTAVAIGFSRRRIWFVYALKNSLMPVLTMLANVVAFTLVGSILVEGIFGWPGIGNYALQAIQNSDFPAIQGFVIYATILYVIVYELLSYVYTLVDPRVRS
jgi:ABC-type dipeptide/oligopeptide/nickel transport system permease component